ncbi:MULTISPECIES: 4-hydroxy-3-methylbut-2-enyl diphosphate reductase [Candidatus Ichthyocystis]|uniref:4-hydroxy-3-methylbut-2-enyl diphosphate reductase n=1 Tax=Candidatus Ichthyocystis hellenicum TaxID=1561003 RepID=A0A0S4M1T6_9BURK|nr:MULTISPECIES: 4-hydroxy-3-methylbut-2-enyl diphosphate reductase [Ichthyocystis]CUT16940.1 4-hydroxy-3-methylbut-2-enyl diphosphate reductase [Candidatus Ichthyocystis hellenicum]
MKIILASPRGFCAGVERAIAIVNNAISLLGPPVYVRHEVVHNGRVVCELKKKGVIFVEELDDVPDGSVLIFSAHGVSRSIINQASKKNCRVFDATCPLVTKVHVEVKKHSEKGFHIIMIGHNGHPEVEGTMGQVEHGKISLIQTIDDIDKLKIESEKIFYVTQTTLSVDDTKQIIKALREKYPHIIGPKRDDICYATQNRQESVKKLIKLVDCLIVIGSPNSSNSRQLKHVAQNHGCLTYMIDSHEELNANLLTECSTVGITAGASVPEELITEVLQKIRSVFPQTQVETMESAPETISFPTPKMS